MWEADAAITPESSVDYNVSIDRLLCPPVAYEFLILNSC